MRDQLEALIMQMYRSNILYSEAVREFKKKFILTVLQENKGNQCRAARELGMHRNTLSRTISELKIDVRQLRDGVKRPPRSARPAGLREEGGALAGNFALLRSPGKTIEGQRRKDAAFVNPDPLRLQLTMCMTATAACDRWFPRWRRRALVNKRALFHHHDKRAGSVGDRSAFEIDLVSLLGHQSWRESVRGMVSSMSARFWSMSSTLAAISAWWAKR